MQKFVTIHLHSAAYAKGFFDSARDAHGLVEEHLVKELADGWRIVQFAGFGGLNELEIRSGWFGVVLEKPDGGK